jgi:hypothetical protein
MKKLKKEEIRIIAIFLISWIAAAIYFYIETKK